jgi:hypothetical protein
MLRACCVQGFCTSGIASLRTATRGAVGVWLASVGMLVHALPPQRLCSPSCPHSRHLLTPRTPPNPPHGPSIHGHSTHPPIHGFGTRCLNRLAASRVHEDHCRCHIGERPRGLLACVTCFMTPACFALCMRKRLGCSHGPQYPAKTSSFLGQPLNPALPWKFSARQHGLRLGKARQRLHAPVVKM